MDLKTQLATIVGKANVLDSPKVLKKYGCDASLQPAGAFTCVVRPKTPEEVQKIVQLANKLKFAVVPQTSGTHFHGCAVPKTGGVVLDLSRQTKITDIVEESNVAHVQVGVTWGQFQKTLAEHKMFSIMPLLPPADRSPVMDCLENVPPTIQSHEFAGPLRSMQMVWGNGELFVSGSAGIDNFRNPGVLSDGALASGPGPMSWDTFLYGAQGTIGIATWAVFNIEEYPVMSKAFFIPATSAAALIDPMYKILRRGVGYEGFMVNSMVLASILAKDPEDLGELEAGLPDWTAIIISRGLKRRPEEKIAYEEDCIREIVTKFFNGLDVLTELPGAPGAERRLPEMLLKPWPADKTYWKHAYLGGCQDLMFMTTLERVEKFIPIVTGVASKFGYAATDIGCYIQPVEDGRACQLEFSFYYDPQDDADKDMVRSLYTEAAAAVLGAGAYFNRPYPLIANMVYAKYGNYADLLKRFKKHYDPKGILSPGNLCF